MNRITGKISRIQQSGAILLVDVDVDGHCFSAMLIESATHPEWLLEGNSIDLVFKELPKLPLYLGKFKYPEK